MACCSNTGYISGVATQSFRFPRRDCFPDEEVENNYRTCNSPVSVDRIGIDARTGMAGARQCQQISKRWWNAIYVLEGSRSELGSCITRPSRSGRNGVTKQCILIVFRVKRRAPHQRSPNTIFLPSKLTVRFPMRTRAFNPVPCTSIVGALPF